MQSQPPASTGAQLERVLVEKLGGDGTSWEYIKQIEQQLFEEAVSRILGRERSLDDAAKSLIVQTLE